MTTRDDTPQLLPLADMTAAHASVTLLERLADKLGARASVTAVYGEPVVGDGITVIPVAEVGFGFGGGAGREVGKDKTGEGGGGGGGAGARPVGFIEIKDGTATYKPLRDPWVDVIVPLTAALLAGTALPRLARRLAKRRTG
ncbi:sporulation protein [Streptomyces ferrugineus]|uniref:Sporulation protein n=1 Tax=Streptomyces ferrugineus TaxID=1413221 RepID=A0A7M2SLI6_9ACTN|nr:spore germination protein GerW family protein [Streptomyces ferrugineus]QOV36879.1 sporulation protein [Streptomyces ferrugineus]